MFNIRTDSFEGIEVITLVNTISEEYASIIPSHGGTIHELVLQKENILYDIISSNASREELVAEEKNYYRGAKLSPFPNRINNGEYEFNGNKYSLRKNDNNTHALHGLLWNKDFKIIEQQTSLEEAVLVLEYSYLKDVEGYPFSYTTSVSYQLDLNGLMVSTTVLNTTGTPIPIGDGWHPYLSTGIEIDRLKLQVPSTKRIETDTALIPTGRIVEEHFFSELSSIGNQTLDTCFILDKENKTSETILFDEEQNISIVLWQKTEGAYPFLHIYTPPDRMSIALEPISCIPDMFNNKASIDILQANESRQYTFGIKIR